MPKIEISTIVEVPAGSNRDDVIQHVSHLINAAKEYWEQRGGYLMLLDAKVQFLNEDGTNAKAMIALHDEYEDQT